ncbi:MAG: leucine-rich repeat protein, partial [Bacilli bacterium]
MKYKGKIIITCLCALLSFSSLTSCNEEIMDSITENKQNILSMIDDLSALTEEINALKTEYDEKIKELGDNNIDAINALKTEYNDKLELLEGNNADAINSLKLEYDDKLATLDTKYSNDIETIKADYDAKIESLKSQYDNTLDIIEQKLETLDETDSSMLTRIIELEEKVAELLEVKTYTVTFDPNNGENPFTQEVNDNSYIIKPTAPEKVGYTFVSWVDESNDSWLFSQSTVHKDMILTASYIKNEYKVNIDGVEGTYYYGDTITLENKEDTEIAVFDGYYDENNILYQGTYIVTDNASLTSKFLNKYTITLDVGDGLCDVTTLSAVYSRTVDSLPTPTKEDYIFVGWFYEDQKYEDDFVYNFNKDITLTAQYVSVDSAFLYETTSEGITITSYLLEDTSVVIPETINSTTVIGVKATTFNGKTNITNVTFPKTITTFEDGILESQSSFEKMTISIEANTTIKKLFNVSTSIELPESFNTIEFNEFSTYNSKLFTGNTNKYNIILPNEMTKISDEAFKNCSNFVSIKLSQGITNIGYSAFYGCSSLTSLIIPEEVTSIGDYAFYGCSSLTSLIIPKGVTSIGSTTFGGCSSLTSLIIPEGVTSIGNYAFYACSSLTSLIIPEGVTSIGNYAFYGCSSLTSLIIPEGVISIGSYAFAECSSLTSLIIPEGVISIGSYAFAECSSLTSLIIPEGVTSIGN